MAYCKHVWGFILKIEISHKNDEPLGHLWDGFESTEKGYNCVTERFEYCPNCGQKLSIVKKSVSLQDVSNVIRNKMPGLIYATWEDHVFKDYCYWVDIAEQFNIETIDELISISKEKQIPEMNIYRYQEFSLRI